MRAVKVWATGSYSSAVLRKIEFNPPVKRTWPLGSRVAVWPPRTDVRVDVRAVKVLATGSYTSAVLTRVEPLYPPVKRTWPLGSKVAVCSERTDVMLDVRAVKRDEITRLTAEPGAAEVPAPGFWLMTFPAGTVVLIADVTVPTTNPAAVIAV